jgi:hypothetical protein
MVVLIEVPIWMWEGSAKGKLMPQGASQMAPHVVYSILNVFTPSTLIRAEYVAQFEGTRSV